MLESAFRHFEASEYTDHFDAFLDLLEREREMGRNYVTLSSIPIALHYKLIREYFIIKRKEKTIRRFFLFKKKVSYYLVKPGNR